MSEGRIHVGTSGWSYDHWEDTFYPEGLADDERLAHYAERLRSVEINNSFYNLPAADTLRSWAETVPEDFLFTVKASRYITHMKKLKDPADSLARFNDRIRALGDKLGPVLFQLPPNWSFDAQRLKGFLSSLSGDLRYVFEFRDHSWINDQALELLKRHEAAFCVYELDGYQSPREVTTDFAYVRLHGPDGPYQGSYDQSALSGWAGALSGWSRQGHDVYLYFDNDENGYAAKNAVSLADMLDAGPA